MKHRAWQGYAAGAAAAIVLYFVLPAGMARNGLYDLIDFSVAVAIVVAVRMHRPARRLGWYLLAAGQVLFAVGDVIWDLYEFSFKVSSPYPGLADVAYLAGYPALAIGLVVLVRSRARGRDRAALLDAAMVTVGVALLSWLFLMMPYISDTGLSMPERVISLAYPLMDLLLLGAVLRMAVGSRSRPALRIMFAGLLTMLVADTVYAWLALKGTYVDGSWVDGLFLGAYALIGIAALHPSMAVLSPESEIAETKVTRLRLAVLAGATLIAPVVLAVRSIRGDHGGEVVIAFAAAAMFIMGMARAWGLVVRVREQAEALRSADEEIRLSEARYRTVVEGIPAVSYLEESHRDDPESWTVLWVSPQVADLLEYSQEEWIAAAPWSSMLHPEDRDRILEGERHRFSTGAPFHEEYRLLTRSGKTLWIHEDAVVVRDEPGQPLLWQGVMFDVTGHRLAQLALRKALTREREAAARLKTVDEMRTTFLHAVSHELRTPLSSILGFALTLERGDVVLSEAERAELLSRLAVNAKKLDRLLADLLDLDRLDRGIIEPQRRRTNLEPLIRRVIGEVESLRGHPVEVLADDVLADVDVAKVERIVENLLVNATRHTPPDTPIWVQAEQTAEGVLLTVEDAGPGVRVAQREQIFEPFRSHGASGSPSPGLGIGLSLVARFAAMHGGRAWVEERPGGGASFKVLLPGTQAGADALAADRA